MTWTPRTAVPFPHATTPKHDPSRRASSQSETEEPKTGRSQGAASPAANGREESIGHGGRRRGRRLASLSARSSSPRGAAPRPDPSRPFPGGNQSAATSRIEGNAHLLLLDLLGGAVDRLLGLGDLAADGLLDLGLGLLLGSGLLRRAGGLLLGGAGGLLGRGGGRGLDDTRLRVARLGAGLGAGGLAGSKPGVFGVAGRSAARGREGRAWPRSDRAMEEMENWMEGRDATSAQALRDARDKCAVGAEWIWAGGGRRGGRGAGRWRGQRANAARQQIRRARDGGISLPGGWSLER